MHVLNTVVKLYNWIFDVLQCGQQFLLQLNNRNKIDKIVLLDYFLYI